MLGMCRQSVIQGAKRGEIPAQQVGDRWLFARAPVEHFLEFGTWPKGQLPDFVQEIAHQVAMELLAVERAGIEARLEAIGEAGGREPTAERASARKVRAA